MTEDGIDFVARAEHDTRPLVDAHGLHVEDPRGRLIGARHGFATRLLHDHPYRVRFVHQPELPDRVLLRRRKCVLRLRDQIDCACHQEYPGMHLLERSRDNIVRRPSSYAAASSAPRRQYL